MAYPASASVIEKWKEENEMLLKRETDNPLKDIAE